jgi:hypothetical protein
MGEGVGHGKSAMLIDWSVHDVKYISAHQGYGLRGCNGLGTTEEAEATVLCEPVTKTGGSTVHSLVVCIANHSSVCSCKNAETMMDKSSCGRRQILKFCRLAEFAITAAHDGDFS